MSEEKWPGDACPSDCAYSMAGASFGDKGRHRHCGYILIAGQSRGCDCGPGCIRYDNRRQPKPRALDVTAGAIRRRKPGEHRMKPTWDTHEGYRMYREGMTTPQIAEVFKISPSTVRNYRQRYWNHGMIGPGEPAKNAEY